MRGRGGPRCEGSKPSVLSAVAGAAVAVVSSSAEGGGEGDGGPMQEWAAALGRWVRA